MMINVKIKVHYGVIMIIVMVMTNKIMVMMMISIKNISNISKISKILNMGLGKPIFRFKWKLTETSFLRK